MYFIDLFCGAGGTSTGAHLAGANVIACVNHDKNAILSHTKNHPGARHFTEDIRDLAVSAALGVMAKDLRKKDPSALICLWASLECTNFSNAKGGKPKKADSRSLAEHMFSYLEEIQPNIFMVENVREFLAWGPLDENGKPLSRFKGRSFLRWSKKVCNLGYRMESRILNSADYGAYQSRSRLFIQFVKEGLPISFPQPTHAKRPNPSDLFEGYKQPWKPVKEVLDLDVRGDSIFNRKKALAESTLNRIYLGLEKFVAGGDTTFLTSYYGQGSAHSIDSPSGTITTKDRYSMIFIDQQFGNGRPKSVDEPCGSLTTIPKYNVVEAQFLLNPQYASKGKSLENPCFTLIARMDKAPPYLVSVQEGEHLKIDTKDSDNTQKIKRFMQAYGIKDISMRMLNIDELKKIQGFPESYELVGTQTEKKKYIGNAVEVNMARSLIMAVINGVECLKKSA
ncbi:DNA cytosine methyltransferase [Flammeovirga agarivorans]|uniref:DNA (cytosine-5-)-methyltransferase n=1 Tax=Flammeovirga agarivorans TaxID=2726742 RepID=A0A7X8XZC0_9BACT|nr:DNA (cytosine-5-)-methyltransferase [Flammeovirga agarivorans]NLR94908.1 DNA cytosine methyltransferase [Flammeovirga agarivorans]